MINTNEKKEILRLHDLGYNNADICRALNWNVSRRTSVHFIIRKYLEELGKDISPCENAKLNALNVSKPLPNKKRTELNTTKAKVLFYDIETTLSKSYHFGQWKQNLSSKQKIDESILLSHSWAWNDDGISGSILTPSEVLNRDCERLVEEAWALFDNADIIIAHNAKRFDIPMINRFFLMYGFPPPSPYKVVDTLLIAKKMFRLPFNSLDYLAKSLNVVEKIENSGIDLWIKCDQGDKEALDEMLDYNLGDIDTLREVYRRIMAWDNQGVNQSLYNDDSDTLCPHCGSDDIKPITDKLTYTPQRKYNVYRCGNCHATMRGQSKQGLGNKLTRIAM